MIYIGDSRVVPVSDADFPNRAMIHFSFPFAEMQVGDLIRVTMYDPMNLDFIIDTFYVNAPLHLDTDTNNTTFYME